MLTGGFMLGQLEPAFKVMDEGRVAMGRYLEVVSAKSVIQAARIRAVKEGAARPGSPSKRHA